MSNVAPYETLIVIIFEVDESFSWVSEFLLVVVEYKRIVLMGHTQQCWYIAHW